MKTTKIKIKKTAMISLVFFLVSLSLFLPLVAAADGDNDGVRDEIEQENKRDISVNYDNDDAKIESKLTTPELYNRFMGELKGTSQGLEFFFEFEKVQENQTVIKFQFTIEEIVEYIDEDLDGVYTSADSIVSTYTIDSYNTLNYTVETNNNETVHVFSIETYDGVFGTTMFVSEEFTVVNEILIAPSQFKFDFEINNYNFTESNSRLALPIIIESEFDVEYEEDKRTEDERHRRATNEEEIEITFGEYTGFFSWVKTAFIDGVEQEVLASPLIELVYGSLLHLNYPQGSEIIHDPKVGVQGQLIGWKTFWIIFPNLSQIELILVSGASLVLISGLVFIVRKKKKRS